MSQEARLSPELGSLTHNILVHECQPVHPLSRCLRVLGEDELDFTHPAGQRKMLVSLEGCRKSRTSKLGTQIPARHFLGTPGPSRPWKGEPVGGGGAPPGRALKPGRASG